MLRFTFINKLIIKSFLNEKCLTILRNISRNPNILTKDLIEILNENNFKLKKSKIYRYITCLIVFNLIINNGWIKMRGYSYKITQRGVDVLDFFSEMFE